MNVHALESIINCTVSWKWGKNERKREKKQKKQRERVRRKEIEKDAINGEKVEKDCILYTS